MHRDYLSDTPYCALWGLWCLNMANCVRYPPPLSERFRLGEHVKRRCDISSPQKGYLSDTGAIPVMKARQNGCDTSVCDTISKRYCAIGGGVSRTGPMRLSHPRFTASALPNDLGQSVLHLAASKGHTQVAMMLLGSHDHFPRPAVNATTHVDNATALHVAVRSGHKAMVSLLFLAGRSL